MNTEILKKYGVSFEKSLKNNKHIKVKDPLNSNLFIRKDLGGIEDFLADIEICLTGYINSVLAITNLIEASITYLIIKENVSHSLQYKIITY